jgi:hypothetical protein
MAAKNSVFDSCITLTLMSQLRGASEGWVILLATENVYSYDCNSK